MSAQHVELRPGAYADSVTLLQVSRAVQQLPGVAAAQVAMATELNVEVLQGMGFEVPDDASANDLVVALRLGESGDLSAALAGVDRALADAARRPSGSAEVAPHRTTAAALRETGAATLVLVSVPGPSAFVEAIDAVESGHDAMVFSDNVPVEQEVALKRTASESGALVMGPDCGTAIVDGVGLGFVNVVAPGPVGLVAASGTGAQQVLALLDHAGVGVTQVLGVGGRDLTAEVGGLSTREALRRLDADPGVEHVLLVSKPPDDAVAAGLDEQVSAMATPVSTALLGAGRPDLTAATEQLLSALGHPVPAWPVAGRTRAARAGGVRGLFVGGTLCTEARLVVAGLLGADGDHTFVDLGDDAYTAGRAHPMIDPTLRHELLARAAADPGTGVLLLDVVLGHGAEPDPAASLAPLLAAVPDDGPPVVVTVVGTAADPQQRDRQVAALVAAGAEVHLSAAGAARRAAALVDPRTSEEGTS